MIKLFMDEKGTSGEFGPLLTIIMTILIAFVIEFRQEIANLKATIQYFDYYMYGIIITVIIATAKFCGVGFKGKNSINEQEIYEE